MQWDRQKERKTDRQTDRQRVELKPTSEFNSIN